MATSMRVGKLESKSHDHPDEVRSSDKTRVDRVRAHTDLEINRRLDEEARRCTEQYAGASVAEISHRLDELEREWDIERVLPFLCQHATEGGSPPFPILCRLGVRSREEIDREKYALKALRGDFQLTSSDDPAHAALTAAKS